MHEALCPTVIDGAKPAAHGSAGVWPGRVLDGTFRIQGPLGKGGMAEVFLARDILLDRDVALKFLAPHLLSNPTWRSRFTAEARSMARVRHGNVVQVHSFGIFEGCPYFAMEYVPGKT